MDDETTTQGGKVLLCPVCGRALNVERLVVEDEQGDDEVFAFDCPTGDFHQAATRAQMLEAAARAVLESLRQELRQSNRADDRSGNPLGGPNGRQRNDQHYSS